MAIREILLLGHPGLLSRSELVQPNDFDSVPALSRDLRDTLHDFRRRNGWARGISAPQIGMNKRIVYLEFDQPWLLVNPRILKTSEQTVDIWDDCMSFPELLVKVRRYQSVVINFYDERWHENTITLEGELAELVQHEIDHLDGTLAVHRAIDGSCFALQSQRHLLGDGVFANRPLAVAA